jgi:hypothetical protein
MDCTVNMSDLLNAPPGSIIRFSGPYPDDYGLGFLGGLQNAAHCGKTSEQWKARARDFAEAGEHLVERIAFWSSFPFTACVLNRLADALEEVTSQIEWNLRMAKQCG